MSHHLDTPLARQNGQLYIDDLYVFGRDRRTVFIMDVNSTITGRDVQPGFHHEAPEVMLSLVVATAVPCGLKPSVAKNLRSSDFPYVVPT